MDFLKRIKAAPCLAPGFFALGMAVVLRILPGGWQLNPGSDDLALRLHTPEPRTKNQTLVQWKDSAGTIAAPVSDATEGMHTGAPSASKECGKVATGKYFLKE